MGDSRVWLRTEIGKLLRADQIVAVDVATSNLRVLHNGLTEHRIAEGRSEVWRSQAPAQLVAALERARLSIGAEEDTAMIVVSVLDEVVVDEEDVSHGVVRVQQRRYDKDGTWDVEPTDL